MSFIMNQVEDFAEELSEKLEGNKLIDPNTIDFNGFDEFDNLNRLSKILLEKKNNLTNRYMKIIQSPENHEIINKTNNFDLPQLISPVEGFINQIEPTKGQIEQKKKVIDDYFRIVKGKQIEHRANNLILIGNDIETFNRLILLLDTLNKQYNLLEVAHILEILDVTTIFYSPDFCKKYKPYIDFMAMKSSYMQKSLDMFYNDKIILKEGFCQTVKEYQSSVYQFVAAASESYLFIKFSDIENDVFNSDYHEKTLFLKYAPYVPLLIEYMNLHSKLSNNDESEYKYGVCKRCLEKAQIAFKESINEETLTMMINYMLIFYYQGFEIQIFSEVSNNFYVDMEVFSYVRELEKAVSANSPYSEILVELVKIAEEKINAFYSNLVADKKKFWPKNDNPISLKKIDIDSVIAFTSSLNRLYLKLNGLYLSNSKKFYDINNYFVNYLVGVARAKMNFHKTSEQEKKIYMLEKYWNDILSGIPDS